MIKISLERYYNLRVNGYTISKYDEINNISPKPLEMYPNMNYKDSNWENEKKKIAEEKKEITLLWQISFKEKM